jgi:transposase
MSQKTCGIDVHRDTLVATIINNQTPQEKQTQTFQNSQDDIQNLKNWLKQHQCQKTTMESTSIYWVPLYLSLEESKFEVTLANAHQVKNIPGRKTDQSDSEWLAHLLKAGLIKPSYVPEKHLRELRELTRLRIKYVQNRTQYKNRCQKVLNRVNIRLRTALTDIFGKAGTEILNGLMEGKTIETILETSQNKQLKTKCEEIKSVAKGALSENDIFILQQLTKTIENINSQIRHIEARIERIVNQRDVNVVSSVPGIGKRSAAAILAEIGDANRFSNSKQIASWSGLTPSLHQSAGTTILGHITKQGSRWLRWNMVEVAHAAVRAGGRFKQMFLRIASKKGKKTAYVAVARKMLTVVWHLLVNGEKYVEKGISKATFKVKTSYMGHVPLETMAEVLRSAGYTVTANNNG